MRSGLVAVLLWLIALAGVAMPLPGQHAAQEPEELENIYHYVPPSASQSVEIGNFYFRRKKYSGALSRYEEAARDDPYYAPAYLGMGKVYQKMGKKREALAFYKKYLDTLPSTKEADEATDAHMAVRHLERELNRERKSHHPAQPTSAGPGR
ncbi:MAG TPA: tetratricopeptide repeat protein [Terriglobia bacterium]|nr:tetratricopeptide repeat protein [Terriglobia bacterium]